MNTNDNPQPPCQCLRTKNAFGSTAEDSHLWPPGVMASSSFWCLLTMGPAGPDEGFAHSTRCVEGRVCFRREESNK
jgi:hypothetical protein